MQIHSDAVVLGRHTGLKLACVFGGVDYEKQRRQFEQGGGHPDRHAGPHHRLLQAARVRPQVRAGVRAGRGRPHVRPRLHRRHPLHAAPDAAARPAPVDAVLGDALAAGAGTGLRAHEQSRDDRDRTGPHHRGQGPPADLLPGDGGKDSAADRAAAPAQCRAHHGVRQHPPPGGPSRGSAARQRHQCPGALRRRPAKQAPAVHAGLPQRRVVGADRHRRGLARPAHPRCEPRVQLRPAAGPRRTTCTASGAPPVPAPRAMPSASPARTTRSACRTSSNTSATPSRGPAFRRNCSRATWSSPNTARARIHPSAAVAAAGRVDAVAGIAAVAAAVDRPAVADRDAAGHTGAAEGHGPAHWGLSAPYADTGRTWHPDTAGQRSARFTGRRPIRTLARLLQFTWANLTLECLP